METGELFDLQADDQLWPRWFTPSKSQPTCARNVARGLHPTGVPLGDAGECCGTCEHRVLRAWSKRWWKCAKGRMSRCAASDIRLKWRACSMWEPEGEAS